MLVLLHAPISGGAHHLDRLGFAGFAIVVAAASWLLVREWLRHEPRRDS
jgi:hypothetical protein